MRKYETIFVIDSLLKSEEIDSIIAKYERFISANGGAIETIERWGKKRLAYEIKKRQYGYYVLIRFDGPPTMIRPLEREYRLNESLLRFKTLAMDVQALKALSAKAAPAPAPVPAPAPEQTEKKVEKETESEPEEAKSEEPAAKEPQETEVKAEEEKVEEPAAAAEEPAETAEETTDDAEEEKVEE